MRGIQVSDEVYKTKIQRKEVKATKIRRKSDKTDDEHKVSISNLNVDHNAASNTTAYISQRELRKKHHRDTRSKIKSISTPCIDDYTDNEEGFSAMELGSRKTRKKIIRAVYRLSNNNNNKSKIPYRYAAQEVSKKGKKKTNYEKEILSRPKIDHDIRPDYDIEEYPGDLIYLTTDELNKLMKNMCTKKFEIVLPTPSYGKSRSFMLPFIYNVPFTKLRLDKIIAKIECFFNEKEEVLLDITMPDISTYISNTIIPYLDEIDIMLLEAGVAMTYINKLFLTRHPVTLHHTELFNNLYNRLADLIKILDDDQTKICTFLQSPELPSPCDEITFQFDSRDLTDLDPNNLYGRNIVEYLSFDGKKLTEVLASAKMFVSGQKLSQLVDDCNKIIRSSTDRVAVQYLFDHPKEDQTEVINKLETTLLSAYIGLYYIKMLFAMRHPAILHQKDKYSNAKTQLVYLINRIKRYRMTIYTVIRPNDEITLLLKDVDKINLSDPTSVLKVIGAKPYGQKKMGIFCITFDGTKLMESMIPLRKIKENGDTRLSEIITSTDDSMDRIHRGESCHLIDAHIKDVLKPAINDTDMMLANAHVALSYINELSIRKHPAFCFLSEDIRDQLQEYISILENRRNKIYNLLCYLEVYLSMATLKEQIEEILTSLKLIKSTIWIDHGVIIINILYLTGDYDDEVRMDNSHSSLMNIKINLKKLLELFKIKKNEADMLRPLLYQLVNEQLDPCLRDIHSILNKQMNSIDITFKKIKKVVSELTKYIENLDSLLSMQKTYFDFLEKLNIQLDDFPVISGLSKKSE